MDHRRVHSLPIQFHFNGKVGPSDGTQTLINVQPVIPMSLNKGLPPMNIKAGGYYNVVHPDNGAEYQVQVQLDIRPHSP